MYFRLHSKEGIIQLVTASIAGLLQGPRVAKLKDGGARRLAECGCWHPPLLRWATGSTHHWPLWWCRWSDRPRFWVSPVNGRNGRDEVGGRVWPWTGWHWRMRMLETRRKGPCLGRGWRIDWEWIDLSVGVKPLAIGVSRKKKGRNGGVFLLWFLVTRPSSFNFSFWGEKFKFFYFIWVRPFL